MGFSVFVEMINLRMRRKVDPVHLKERYVDESGSPTGATTPPGKIGGPAIGPTPTA
jgi:hypothetical protein